MWEVIGDRFHQHGIWGMEYLTQSSVTASASCTQIPVDVQTVPPMCGVGSYQSSCAVGGMSLQ